MEFARYEHETDLLKNQLRQREQQRDQQKQQWESRELQMQEQMKQEQERRTRQASNHNNLFDKSVFFFDRELSYVESYGCPSKMKKLKKNLNFGRNFIKISIKFQLMFISKGQLFSKCPFGVIEWTKIPTKI